MIYTARDKQTGQPIYTYKVVGVTPQGKFQIKIIERFEIV
jgi:hypothetical protein